MDIKSTWICFKTPKKAPFPHAPNEVAHAKEKRKKKREWENNEMIILCKENQYKCQDLIEYGSNCSLHTNLDLSLFGKILVSQINQGYLQIMNFKISFNFIREYSSEVLILIISSLGPETPFWSVFLQHLAQQAPGPWRILLQSTASHMFMNSKSTSFHFRTPILKVTFTSRDKNVTNDQCFQSKYCKFWMNSSKYLL